MATPVLRSAAPLGACAVLCLAASLGAQDPFQPGLRWSAPPDAAEPWHALSADFAAGGELAWCSGSIGNPRVQLWSTAAIGAAVTLELDTALAGAIGTLVVAGSPSASRLFSAAQFPAPDTSHRRSLVSCYDALAAAHGAPFAPVWSHDLELVANGPVKLAVDAQGARVLAAVHDASSGILRADWIDAASGALLARADRTAGSLRALALDRAGARAALVAGAELVVLESDGSTSHQESLSGATNALALSGDGQVIAVGAGDRLRILRRTAGTFAETAVIAAAPQELATRCALSSDGANVAVGWWDAASGDAVRFEVWSGAIPTRCFQHAQRGGAASLQNFPETVLLTPDGRRAAFGCWGQLDAQPEVLLADVATGALVLGIDLPGSPMTLALDPTGTRVLAGMKHAHANQLAQSGEFRLYDSGERDLQLVAQPMHGGTLACSSLEPGSTTTLFVLGLKSTTPLAWPGASGTLWIDDQARMRVIARTPDAQGRANLTMPLGAALIGYPLAVQALAHIGGALVLSEAVLEPVIF